MRLIDTLRPEDRRALRRFRKRIANRAYMRRVRAARKLCCIGVGLPIEAGTCGGWCTPRAERCIHCAKRRRWLLAHALNPAEVAITGLLEERDAPGAKRANDAGNDVPNAVPLLDDLSDLSARSSLAPPFPLRSRATPGVAPTGDGRGGDGCGALAGLLRASSLRWRRLEPSDLEVHPV